MSGIVSLGIDLAKNGGAVIAIAARNARMRWAACITGALKLPA